MAPSLSALLIAKDEQHRLARCLGSLDGVVDEIVVVDTGSTDDTVSIARSMGAIVGRTEWEGDFAKARNASLQHARTAWILWIDADEWVASFDRGLLNDELADETCLGRLVGWRPAARTVPIREMRLFRNHPDLRFHGVVHADLNESMEAIMDETGLVVRESHLRLEHDGYDDDQLSKHDQRLPMLQRRAEADPDHVLTWFDLGRIRAQRGDRSGAIEAHLSALEAARRNGVPRTGDVVVFCALTDAARHDGLPDGIELDATELLGEAMATYGPLPGLQLLEAQLAADDGRHDDAIRSAKPLVSVDLDAYVDGGVAWDARVFGEWPWALMGACHFAAGRYEEAALAYGEAAKRNPSPELRAKLAVARARAGRSASG